MIHCDTDETWYVIPYYGWEVKPVQVVKRTECYVTIRTHNNFDGDSTHREKIADRYYRDRAVAVAHMRAGLQKANVRAEQRYQFQRQQLEAFDVYEASRAS